MNGHMLHCAQCLNNFYMYDTIQCGKRTVVVVGRVCSSSGIAKPGPTQAWAQASASRKQLNIVFCSILFAMMQFPTHVWHLKTCTACTYAEVMGQNYSRFKTDGISKIVSRTF